MGATIFKEIERNRRYAWKDAVRQNKRRCTCRTTSVTDATGKVYLAVLFTSPH